MKNKGLHTLEWIRWIVCWLFFFWWIFVAVLVFWPLLFLAVGPEDANEFLSGVLYYFFHRPQRQR